MNNYQELLAAKFIQQATSFLDEGSFRQAEKILALLLEDQPGNRSAIDLQQEIIYNQRFSSVQCLPKDPADLDTIAHLAATHGYYQMLPLIARQSKQSLIERFKDDLLLQNFAVNCWEYATGQTYLSTYPWNVSLPIAETCNAKCHFCDSYHNKNGWIDVNVLSRFKDILLRATDVGLIGYGEPLAHPEFTKILSVVRENTDSRCSMYTITNGFLLDRYKDILLDANFGGYCVSLNAGTARTHDRLMGFGEEAFHRIIDSLSYIKNRNPNAKIQLSMVVTGQNLAEVPEFIRVAERLAADNIYIRTLIKRDRVPDDAFYHRLPPYLHPDFALLQEVAVKAISSSRVPVSAVPDTWGLAVFPEEIDNHLRQQTQSIEIERPNPKMYFREREPVEVRTCGRFLSEPGQEFFNGPNPYNRKHPLKCSYPYINFNISSLDYLLTPCCFMPSVPGYERTFYDGSVNFFDVWNSPAYLALRHHLFNGPLHRNCYTCMSDSVLMDL